MNFTIIGAGNGGIAIGARLLQLGAKVKLFEKFQSVIQPIIDNKNTVTLEEDDQQEILQFSLVTDNLKEAIQGSNYIFVVTPAFAHNEIALELSKMIENDQTVILNPGRTGGALVVKKILEDQGKPEVIVAEAETLLYACRKTSNTSVCIYGEKEKVGIASLPSIAIHKIVEDLTKYLPCFYSYPNVLYTSFNNIGAIFHPAPFLLNIGKVDRKENFKYYHEGISPYIAAFLEQLDKERVEIARKFSIPVPTAEEWVKESYNVKGTGLYEVIQANSHYHDIFAPTDINSRYVHEDIPMSLVPLSELARTVKVKTPYMDTIIDLACTLYKKDFRAEGRTLTEMGLENHFESIHKTINNHFSTI